MRLVFLLALLPALVPGADRPPTAAEIMARVAENQDRAEKMREAYVYQQSILARMHRSNGKFAREESSEYVVTPTATGSKAKRTHFLGKYEHNGKIVEYHKPNHEYKDIDIDGDLISDLAEELAQRKNSRDGVSADLFPLTRREQAKYSFKLEGREDYRGHEVYRITFKPLKRKENSGVWAGEVLVDSGEFQPVLVTTRLAARIPLVVRTALGTNLKHLGFKLTYGKFDEGVWFPVSYGGEFYLQAVFFYKRKISLSLQNSGFQKADVESTLTFEAAQ